MSEVDEAMGLEEAIREAIRTSAGTPTNFDGYDLALVTFSVMGVLAEHTTTEYGTEEVAADGKSHFFRKGITRYDAECIIAIEEQRAEDSGDRINMPLVSRWVSDWQPVKDEQSA